MMTTTRPSALVLLSGQQRLHLRDQVRLLHARLGAERMHDGQVQTTRAERRRGNVDDVVRARIQLASGGTHGDGFADAHLASDDAQQRLADAEADTGDGFLVAGAITQLGGRDGLTERCTREAEVGDPGCAAHRSTSDAARGRSQ
jgi:hypothetical protein